MIYDILAQIDHLRQVAAKPCSSFYFEQDALLMMMAKVRIGTMSSVSDCLIAIAILSLAHSMRSETRNDNIIVVMAQEILLWPRIYKILTRNSIQC